MSTATSAAARGATYLIALQISSRALTFILNQVLLRFLTPETLGRAVQLELYSISVLFFARESLRVAVQRVGASGIKPTHDDGLVDKGTSKAALKPSEAPKPSAVQIVVNLSYLSLVIGIPLATALGALSWTSLSGSQAIASATPYLGNAIFIYGLAAIVELASEPGFVAAQAMLLFKVRAGAEAAATVVKTFGTVGSALTAYRLGLDVGVLPFAIGQLAFASTLVVFYAIKLGPVGKTKAFSLLPSSLEIVSGKKTEDTSNNIDFYLGYFSRPLLQIATSLSIQSGIKYILTQGDSILITALATLQDQGSYALASNYGGLIARMLFQPIEEASRNLFAKLCSDESVTMQSSSPAESTKPREPSPSVARAALLLRIIVKLYLLVSLPIVALGPSLAPPLLSLVAGQRWIALGAGDVLAAYAYYIPFLALNGILEAFVSATANNAELYKQSVWMAVSFVLFAGTAWQALGWGGMGAKGVVLANVVNMMGRIGWCWGFVGRWFHGRAMDFGLVDVLPSSGSVAATAAVPVLLNVSRKLLSAYGVFGEIVRVGAVGVLLIGAMAIFETQFLKECYSLTKSR
ncbi:hypothetical protein CAC42_8078 [Sphaceloma murrayae]|uniref:Man(5)GlcNAc(2)-PP-dolichol translocation protein RFT1 n=1 Tax=Sphaceloma murrayae TaxID=2082308 RepID=A0A2K1QR60_9PEZI|nr:hypothetical protein CAC42_8078 [Sphaceloma murrayae]